MRTRRQHSIVVLALSLSVCSPASAAGVLSPQFWAKPVAVDGVNTSYHDKAPFLSFDGLTLYFSRGDGPGWHYTRIYQASRQSLSAAFGQPQEISSLNSAGGHVDYPWVSPDNLRMYYYSTESGKRLKISKRNATTEAWPKGTDIAELDKLGELANPTLTEDELTIVFSGYNLPGGRGGWDLWMAGRPDRNSPFSNVTNLRTLNTASWDMHASLAPTARRCISCRIGISLHIATAVTRSSVRTATRRTLSSAMCSTWPCSTRPTAHPCIRASARTERRSTTAARRVPG